MRSSTRIFDPRQTMKRADYEVFHYRDSKNCEVEVHHHDFYEIYFFLGGKASCWIEGTSYPMEVGDLLFIGPSELHRPVVEETSVYERIVLWIDKNYLESLSTDKVSLTRCFDSSLPTHRNLLRPTPTMRAEITHRLGELLRELYNSDYGGEVCARGILLQFMVELNRMAMGGAESGRQLESSPLISNVLQYIGDHYNENLTVENIASEFFVSKYHLSHEFSRVVGTSVYRYILLRRLLIARQLLSRGVAPGVVSANCGFGDYTNFYRAFKAQYGVSPASYKG